MHRCRTCRARECAGESALETALESALESARDRVQRSLAAMTRAYLAIARVRLSALASGLV